MRIGIKEHIIFPEIDYDKVEQIVGHGHHGLHHGARPTTKRGRLLTAFNFPFRQ